MYKSTARLRDDMFESTKASKSSSRPKSPLPKEPKLVSVSLRPDARSKSVTSSRRKAAPGMQSGQSTAEKRPGEISERLLRYQHIYEEKRKELQEQKEKEVMAM